ncbi:hypothetical protein PM082_012588 [Marasmius tenuissimus]|nr:hypothetical protein PM082_012588 [Marasmius tenuissimus]
MSTYHIPFTESLLCSLIVLHFSALFAMGFSVETPFPATMTISQPYTFTWHRGRSDSNPLFFWLEFYGENVHSAGDMGRSSTITTSTTGGVVTLTPTKTGNVQVFCWVWNSNRGEDDDVCPGDVIRIVQTPPPPPPPTSPPPPNTVQTTSTTSTSTPTPTTQLAASTPTAVSTTTSAEASAASTSVQSPVTQSFQRGSNSEPINLSSTADLMRSGKSENAQPSHGSVSHSIHETGIENDTTTPANTSAFAATPHPRMPAIIGGIVGGVVVLIIVTVIILILLMRRCRHRRQVQKARAEPIPLGPPYDESFGNSPTSATSLLGAVGDRKSTSSLSKEQTEKPPAGLYPLRFMEPSSSRGDLEDDEKKEPESEAPSNLPEPGLVKDPLNQGPFSIVSPDETGQPESTERAPEDTNEPDSESETRNPAVPSDTRVTSAGPSLIDNEQLIARLEYMAQRIAWLESEGRSPPQYTQ